MDIPKRLQKDMAKVQSMSSAVEKRLDKNEERISKFTTEELEDLDKILQTANFLLCKYEDKIQVHSLLKEFVDMVSKYTDSLNVLSDQIIELEISAGSTAQRIKDVRCAVSGDFKL